MKNLNKGKRIVEAVVLSILLLSTLAGISSSQNLSDDQILQDQAQQSRSGREYTHTVLAEQCTATWCGYCPAVAGYLWDMWTSGDYDFNFVALVSDKNGYANSRISELGITGYPTVWWDWWIKEVGSQGGIQAQINRCNAAGARQVSDIDLTLEASWLGNAQIGVNLDITNNEGSSYDGHVHVYITEIESRWYASGHQYHFAMIGNYAINQDVTITAGDTTTLAQTWDGNTYGFGDIQENNIFIVASIFDGGTHRVDETTGSYVGESDPPEIPQTPQGPSEGEVGVEYQFYTVTTDPEQEDVYYQFDWGEEIGDWVGPFDSGDQVNISHIFTMGGNHEVKVRAKDTSDAQSDWSESIYVEIDGPILEIGDVRGTLVGLSAEIMNTGTMDTENVNYSITVTGGLFHQIDYIKEGTISSLHEDDESTKIAKPILGIGSIEIVVQAEAFYGGSVEKRLTGKALFFILQIDDEE